jgi:hypothetical protein
MAYLYNFNYAFDRKGFTARLNYQADLKQWIVKVGGGLKIEQYMKEKQRNHYHVELGLSYKF